MSTTMCTYEFSINPSNVSKEYYMCENQLKTEASYSMSTTKPSFHTFVDVFVEDKRQ